MKMIFPIGKRVYTYCIQMNVCGIFMQYQIKYIDYLAHVGKGHFFKSEIYEELFHELLIITVFSESDLYIE